MNEWNLLETLLRSWTPRRPSAKLKARLFTEPAARTRAWRSSLGWLAPASVSFLLLFMTFIQRNGELARLTAASRQVPLMAVTFSNMSFAAYLPGSFANDQNTVRPDNFEWTNHGHFISSTASFPQANTNDPKP